MATPPARPRLRGRDAELRALGATLDRAASGRVAVAVVEGEAGIGKTRLLAEVADEARRRGFQVASGRADELERTRPFGLLTDAFACTPGSPDPRRAGIAALLTTRVGDRGLLTVTSDPGLQFQAVDAFVDLVEALALEDPLLAGLDDLQWADPSSLLAVGAIGRRLTDVPVALVACLRPAPRPAELERLLAGLDGARRSFARSASSPTRPWPSWWPRRSAPSRAGASWARWRPQAATRCSSPSWWARSSRTESSARWTGGPR